MYIFLNFTFTILNTGQPVVIGVTTVTSIARNQTYRPVMLVIAYKNS